MIISIIAAVSRNGVIGNHGEIPWHIPEDLQHFKKLTTGHTVIMGQHTYESIIKRLGHPLPDRSNIVLTRQPQYQVADGVITANSFEQLLEDLRRMLSPVEEVFIIGGGEVYHSAITKADKMYLTEIDREVEGDVYFPYFSDKDWEMTGKEPHEGYTFVSYARRS